jgi:hypothetical protein
VKWQTSAEIEKIAKFNLFYFRTISVNSFSKNSGNVYIPLKGRISVPVCLRSFLPECRTLTDMSHEDQYKNPVTVHASFYGIAGHQRANL